MNKLLLAASFGVAALAAAPAASADDLYFGAGYTAFKTDVANDDVLVGGAFARLGYKFNPILGVEGEVAFGVNDDNYQVGATEFDFGVDNGYGAYGVVWLPIPFVADIFARAGYADLSFDNSNPLSPTDGGSGLAYGGGVQFNILVLKVRADYTRYELDDDDVDSLGASVLLQF